MAQILALAIAALFSCGGVVMAQEGYAGSDSCKECHSDMFSSYEKSIHGVREHPRTPGGTQGCESCHGPGAAHVQAGGGKGVGGIKGLGSKSDLKPDQRNEVCIGCHENGGLALWHGGTHEQRGISCGDCHRIHGGQKALLAGSNQPDVCGKCHQNINGQLLKSSHHPIREGKMSCTDCHNPHGTVADNLIAAVYPNEKCYECHTEKRGPFLWEHPPATENCMSCHTPHGSAHDKLLVQKRPYLCQTCHSNSRHPGTLYGLNAAQITEEANVFSLSGNRLYDRACQNCHSQMHGSNHPSGKSLLR